MNKIFVIMVMCLLTSCSNHNKVVSQEPNDSIQFNHSPEWKQMKEEVNSYWMNYLDPRINPPEKKSPIYLDSALNCIDLYTEKYGYNEVIVTDKIIILVTLSRFEEAENYFTSVSDNLFGSFPSHYREEVILRIKSIEALRQGNSETAKKYYHSILNLVEEDVEKMEKKISDYLKNYGETKNVNDDVWLLLHQFFAYTNMAKGREVALKRLDEFYEKYPDGKKMDEILRYEAEKGFNGLEYDGL